MVQGRHGGKVLEESLPQMGRKVRVCGPDGSGRSDGADPKAPRI